MVLWCRRPRNLHTSGLPHCKIEMNRSRGRDINISAAARPEGGIAPVATVAKIAINQCTEFLRDYNVF